MSTELIARLRGHAEIMVRDKGKFVRFIESADCVEAADLIEAQAAEIERLIAEVMLQMRWKTDTQQYADKLEAEIERLRGANKAAAECVAAMTQECARYRNEIRNALENKP